jgi:hypothetical protein
VSVIININIINIVQKAGFGLFPSGDCGGKSPQRLW